ncbi:MAG: hypothetical protein ACODAU_13615, partial [Myxococcota bacterium]
MSAAVERLQDLLARVQRNRNAPRRPAAPSAGGEASQAPSKGTKPTPLEMAVEVELDRPKKVQAPASTAPAGSGAPSRPARTGGGAAARPAPAAAPAS